MSTATTAPAAPAALPRRLLTTLALGTFAIGTESFMIAGLLPPGCWATPWIICTGRDAPITAC